MKAQFFVKYKIFDDIREYDAWIDVELKENANDSAYAIGIVIEKYHRDMYGETKFVFITDITKIM